VGSECCAVRLRDYFAVETAVGVHNVIVDVHHEVVDPHHPEAPVVDELLGVVFAVDVGLHDAPTAAVELGGRIVPRHDRILVHVTHHLDRFFGAVGGLENLHQRQHVSLSSRTGCAISMPKLPRKTRFVNRSPRHDLL